MTADDLFARAWQAQQAGDVHAAEEGYRKILRSNRRDARVWFTLGQLCAAQGRLFEAVVHMHQALEIQPHEAGGYLHLGNTLLQDKRYTEAEPAYRRCLELAPNTLEALINLGFVLGELHRIDEARACYEQARSLDPTVPEAHHNLANILRDQGRLEEALVCYDEALRLRPDYSQALVNRGVALVFLGDAAEAVASMRRGVALEPDFAEAHNSLGTGLSALGRLDEAVAACERAIQLRPDCPDAHWNRCLLRLLQGDYARGWQEYEWRWSCKHLFQLPAVTQPRWDGSPLAGRTILLHAEQGQLPVLDHNKGPRQKVHRAGRLVQSNGVEYPTPLRCWAASSALNSRAQFVAPVPSTTADKTMFVARSGIYERVVWLRRNGSPTGLVR
jgi:tetratricopeptide (TPR) repeat protein